ncbi:MAG: AMP-binding protein [Acidimicrobiia bacterium]
MHTIPHLVQANARRIPDKPALRRRVDGAWETITWSDYARGVGRAANAMIASGIEVGDRVGILSYNSPEWVIFDVAAMAAGAVPVGIYFSSSEEEIADVLAQSNARIVLAGTGALADKIDIESHPSLDLVVGVESAPAGVLSWQGFLDLGDDAPDGVLEQRIAGLRPEDPATLIFTAAGFGGTVGVILTHDNLVFASGVAVEVFEPTSDDRVLSYLPLSHIAEQMFTIHIAAHAGYSVAFAQSIGRIRVDLPEIQPTIFFSVPLVWSGFERAIRAQVDALEGWRSRIAAWSMRVSHADIAARNASRRRSLFGRVSVAVARRLFTNRVRSAVGFGNLRLAFSGAVSANPATLEYFSGLDLVIREVYGLSEASGPSIITQEGATRYGSVGFPFPGIEAGIADDGEIVLRGRSVFAGYLDNPEATRRALRDGWLHTGDLGSIGSDGLFTITGRKKDIVITNGGKNVCPRPIERLLREDPIIVDAVIVGDGYDQLGVLVSIVDGLNTDAAVEQVEARVGDVNQRFARAEQIRKIGLLPRALSVEEGERLASGAVFRNVVVEHFSSEIADLYR